MNNHIKYSEFEPFHIIRKVCAEAKNLALVKDAIKLNFEETAGKLINNTGNQPQYNKKNLLNPCLITIG